MTAQENLARVIHNRFEFEYDECDHGITRGSGPNNGEPYAMCERWAGFLVAFLTSDEMVLSAASAMADLSSDRPEASWADLWVAGVAALGVESPPFDPASEAELICGDYPAPCNHNPAHKKGAE